MDRRGSTIAVGRQLLSLQNTLIVHAIVAPVVFALLARHFFHRFPDASPFRTSLGLVGTVVGLDALIVAPLLEHSYAMFTSPLGTWIPFASMWLASFFVGHASRLRLAVR
jgi:hypothetical protein